MLAFLTLAAGAAAAVDPRVAALQKSLKGDMVKTFAQRAPGLKITTVTCKLPSSGTVATCIAHFTAGTIKGYYPVRAVILSSGQLRWTASTPKCFVAKTGKPTRC